MNHSNATPAAPTVSTFIKTTNGDNLELTFSDESTFNLYYDHFDCDLELVSDNHAILHASLYISKDMNFPLVLDKRYQTLAGTLVSIQYPQYIEPVFFTFEKDEFCLFFVVIDSEIYSVKTPKAMYGELTRTYRDHAGRFKKALFR
jgi:hypothetical protein